VAELPLLNVARSLRETRSNIADEALTLMGRHEPEEVAGLGIVVGIAAMVVARDGSAYFLGPLMLPLGGEASTDEYLLCEIVSDLKTTRRTLHPDALQQLMSYRFPGNVRELRNLLERACILTSSPEIIWFDLQEVLQHETEAESGLPVFSGGPLPEEFHLRSTLASWERRIIEQTLAKTNGSKSEAARRLGLSKSDLSYKLSKYSLSDSTLFKTLDAALNFNPPLQTMGLWSPVILNSRHMICLALQLHYPGQAHVPNNTQIAGLSDCSNGCFGSRLAVRLRGRSIGAGPLSSRRNHVGDEHAARVAGGGAS
jgi:hypothetical protein